MPVEFREEGGQLVWVKNPFTGTVTYFTDLQRKPNGFSHHPSSHLEHPWRKEQQGESPSKADLQAAQAKCNFCPGNEHLTEAEVLRIPPCEIPDAECANSPWLIRGFYNIVPRIPPCCTGGRNESYVLVEDPRHFTKEAAHPEDLLCSSMLPRPQFQWVMRTAVAIAERSYANPSVKAVLIRKNQGRESGASQPHIHTQIIGSPEPFLPVNLERERLAEESGLLAEILDFVEDYGFVIARENGAVLYFCPWGTFPSGYEIVCPEIEDRITEIPAAQLDAFSALLHRGLRILGSLPLDFEIHDGPGVPLHAHLSLRRFPYSNMGGTLNLPIINPAVFRSTRIDT